MIYILPPFGLIRCNSPLTAAFTGSQAPVIIPAQLLRYQR